MRRFLVLALFAFSAGAQAQTEIRLWHSMSGALGEVLQSLVQRFNESQKDFRVVDEHKGGYERSLIQAMKAQETGSGPDLVQVYELGTAHLMAAKRAYRPVWQVLAEAGEKVDPKGYLPAVGSYFSDDAGRLLGLPFNVSTPILFFNKDAFRKAKLDPDKLPRSWYEMPPLMGAILESGLECAYTTTWPAWVHIENMSTWHNQDFATKDNGLGGLDAKLIFNTHLMIRHVSFLSSWARAGYFTYSGRRLEAERRFEKGECAMLTASSASMAELRRDAKFEFGVAELPHYDDVKGAPHHTMIGGAALWVLAGRPAASYKGAAKFLAFLARAEIAAEWHQRTGFVPVTRAAYELTRNAGYYGTNPGHEIAINQLLLRSPTRESRGIRLGNFEQIRGILEEELEAVWSGDRPPKLALDNAAERGNALLRSFERQQRAGAEPGVPARVPRKKK
ncbi:MAG: sn-glycerol-3-phosphate ABC transporter substrate-binding protein UgpB [Betaproteobacteria bacterium]